VNVTLCFSAGQALLAAKAGAYIISPFVGRLDDIGSVGMDLIRSIVQIYRNYGYKTQVLAASLRGPTHVIDSAMAGAHMARCHSGADMLFNHPLTTRGWSSFLGLNGVRGDGRRASTLDGLIDYLLHGYEPIVVAVAARWCW
jgi:transaldolase